MKQRIVITGASTVTPFGVDKNNFFENIVSGKSCIKEITKFPNQNIPAKLGGEISSEFLRNVIRDERLLRTTFISQLALTAGILCVQDAKVRITKDNSSKIGIFFATSQGSINAVEKIYKNLLSTGPQSVDPLLFAETVFNAPASLLSIKLGIRGPCVVMPMGNGGSGSVLAYAIHYLRTGLIDYALVGAADELSEGVREAYFHLGILSPCDTQPEGSRPFDKTRNGVVLSEGSGFIMLEILNNAEKRNAHIYGEIIGFGMCNDGYRLADCDPTGIGVSMVIKRALNSANIREEEIDYICAFANSLKDLDLVETKGIKAALGDYAYKCPVSTIKGATGMLGATGLFYNIIISCLAIKYNVIPPTINYKHFDPECDLNLVTNNSKIAKLNTVLVEGYCWGGIYNSFILRKV